MVHLPLHQGLHQQCLAVPAAGDRHGQLQLPHRLHAHQDLADHLRHTLHPRAALRVPGEGLQVAEGVHRGQRVRDLAAGAQEQYGLLRVQLRGLRQAARHIRGEAAEVICEGAAEVAQREEAAAASLQPGKSRLHSQGRN